MKIPKKLVKKAPNLSHENKSLKIKTKPLEKTEEDPMQIQREILKVLKKQYAILFWIWCGIGGIAFMIFLFFWAELVGN